MKQSILFGLVAGLTTFAFLGLIYFINENWLFHPAVFWLSLFFYIWMMTVNGFRIKRQFAGAPDWRLMIREIFLVFIVANFFFWLGYYFLMNVYTDLGALKTKSDIAFLEISATMIASNLTPAELQEIKNNITAENSQIRLGDVAFRFALGSVGGFLLSLFIGFLIKRK